MTMYKMSVFAPL